MANALPYYPLYVWDFDEDTNVLAMNLAEVGLYQLALNESWKRGSIPADPKELAVKIRRKPAEVCRAWPKVQPCWIENGVPGRLVNPRQERERRLALDKSAMASIAGSASANARKEKDRVQRTLVPYAFESESVSESGLEASTDTKTTTRAQESLVDFEMFLARWAHHPGFKKPNKAAREKSELRWVKIRMDEQELTVSLNGYYRSEWARSQHYPILGFLKDPLSWIPDDVEVPPEADAPESHPEAPQHTELALVRDYPSEWNSIVLAAPYEWNGYAPRKRLGECVGDPVFVEKFHEACEVAQRIHESRGGEVGWITLPWTLAKGKGENPPGWYRLLTDLRWMAHKEESSDDRLIRELEMEQRTA